MATTSGGWFRAGRASFGTLALAAVLAALPATTQAGDAEADGSKSVGASRGAPSAPVNPARVEAAAPPHRVTQGEGPWGAIAYWRFGSQWRAGAAANYDTPLYAEFRAREQCGPVDECNVAVTLEDECGALAVSVLPAPFGDVVMEWAKGATEAGAREEALGKCRATAAGTLAENPVCAVEMSVCSGNVAGADGAAARLPPEIELDRFLLLADQAVEDGDSPAARSAMERIEALQEEHGIEPAPEDHFRYARVWRVAGEPQRARAAVTKYLQLMGREAPDYLDALRLLNEAEAGARGGAALSARSATGSARGGDPLAAPPTGPAGMEFVWIPAGEFSMGSTSSEALSGEQPVTAVRISRGFWLGKYEVTQEEWEEVMGSNPSEFSGCGRCPVEQVSWEDVQEFIGRLNAREGSNVYWLPTEAAWEYAARGGTSGDRYGDMDAIAWHDGNGGDRTHPVGGKTPNGFGLHDMVGNVWEWVQDWYGDYPGGLVTDPRGPGSGSFRVLRGGGWGLGARTVRAPARARLGPGVRDDFLGFRLLRTTP